jgi:putative sigma-54 modulation protein
MQTKLTARHFDLTTQIREKAEEELEGLQRFHENIISAELILDVEKHRRLAEVRVKVARDILTATGDSDDMYKSISLATDKMKSQLKKHKERLKEKNVEEISDAREALTRPLTNPDVIDQ